MAKAKATADVNLCKGCRLCVGACPVQAIEPLGEINKKGYEIIRIHEDACIGWGAATRFVRIMYLPLAL